MLIKSQTLGLKFKDGIMCMTIIGIFTMKRERTAWDMPKITIASYQHGQTKNDLQSLNTCNCVVEKKRVKNIWLYQNYIFKPLGLAMIKWCRMYFCLIMNLLNCSITFGSNINGNSSTFEWYLCNLFCALIVHIPSRSTSNISECLVHDKLANQISAGVKELVSKGETSRTVK